MTLCADAAAFVAAIDRREGEWKRPLAELRREERDAALAFGGTPERVAAVEDLDADGVPARLYRPCGDAATEALVWFHGGAWMLGDLDAYDALACALANRAGCAVLSVDYRLAPEHPYPAAVDDCWAAARWAAERFARIAVGGDSAGGNLAAAIALRARDARLALALQLLVYPALDPRLDAQFVADFVARYRDFAGMARFGEDALLELRHAWATYVPDAADRAAPDAAPMRAATLAGTAPALILLAEHDILRGEGEAYAARLQADGVPVELDRYDGQIHGFYHLLGAMRDAHDAVDRTARALTLAFERTTA